MQGRPGFVDIHCHLAPGIDDGAQSWDECLAMARIAHADGVDTVIITPHQQGSFAHNDGDTIRYLAGEVQEFLREHGVPLRILPGADVRIEAGMVNRIRRGEVLSLADLRKHVLLELPHELYLPLEPLLEELHQANMTGILSHPERNVGILSNPSLVGPLVDAGCLMQVTAGSLVGAFGARVQRISEDFLTQGLVHFISSDGHGTKSRRPTVSRAFQRVCELTDVRTAIRLCCENPGKVARGEKVVAGRSRRKSTSLSAWFGWKKVAA